MNHVLDEGETQMMKAIPIPRLSRFRVLQRGVRLH
jgi:hypothetical protein